jgi:hypothetical protein
VIPAAMSALPGKVAANVDVHFTVQPDLSGKNDFVVRAKW